ncbi:MAG TPA: tetratricopeptide repeat protein [Nitrospirota bacterium]
MLNTPGRKPTDIPDGRTTALHALLILLVVSAAYFNTLHYGFVTDDFGLFVDNPNTKSWERLARIFTTGYWDAEGGTGGLYRPLTILSFLVEYTVAGLDPVIYHIDNILLHFLCSALAYLVMREVFDGWKAPLFAALLFAAHPVHTEAVTWVSGRAELLWAAFGLGSMLVFMRYGGRLHGMLVSCGLFFLGLLCKESVVVVPLMLTAYMLLYVPPGPGLKRPVQLVKRLWPYFALSALVMPVRVYVLGGLGPRGGEQALSGVGAYDRFLTMSRVLFEYVRLGFFPADLKAAYMFPPPGSIFEPRVLFGIAVALSTVLFARRLTSFSRPAYLGALWFFTALLPVSNIIPAGVIMSERAMYIPSLGICMIMAAAIAGAEKMLHGRTGRTLPYGALLLLPVVGLFMAGAAARNPIWQSQEVYGKAYMEMMRGYIDRYPGHAILYRHMANMRLRFFDFGPETEKAIDEAYKKFGGDDPEMMYMRAYSYLQNDRPGDALREIMALIDRYPASGRDYYFAASALAVMKRYDESMRMLDTAIEMNPNKDTYQMLKGRVLMEAGDDDNALKVFEQVSRLNPENYDSFLMQGIILDSKKQFGPAIEKVRHAVELKPDMPDLHYFLAVAYLDAGEPGQARGELEKAVALRPDYREASELLERLRQGR